jgi:hypothetical protein
MLGLITVLLIIVIGVVAIPTSRNWVSTKLGLHKSSDIQVVSNVEGESETIPDGDNYELIPSGAEGFLNTREPQTTWEPSTSAFNGADNNRLYRAYGEDLKANVDQGIINSHRDYVSDSNFLATTGASHASARDDFMPAVKFHGLPRKAHYAAIGADHTARVGQSETPGQVVDIADHNSTGYVL